MTSGSANAEPLRYKVSKSVLRKDVVNISLKVDMDDIDDEQGEESAGGLSKEHYPVMLKEALDLLDLRPGLTYVDATAGAGGHLAGIVEATGGKSKVIAFDQDQNTLSRLSERFGDKVTLIHSNFRYLKAALSKYGVNTVDGGIIADLGVSSMQIDQPHRGFSFQKDGPLDMRMDTSQKLTASDIVNHWSEEDIANIIFEYGEERHSRKIARRIVEHRPINSTLELSAIVSRCLAPLTDNKNKKNRRKNFSLAGGGTKSGIHPATRTFQALRMAVNAELDSLSEFLQEASSVLKPGARLVVITFHSLEDRVVKQFFKTAAQSCICPPRVPLCQCHKTIDFLTITRKPITASEEELLANTRSRSAKLRAGQKLN